MECALMTQSNVQTKSGPKVVSAETNATTLKKSRRLFFWVAAIVLIIDQATKWWVEATIPLNTSTIPLEWAYPYFQFTHVANTGAAFGLFKSGAVIFAILAVIVAGALLYYNLRLKSANRWLRLSLGLLFGGAVGNLIDRLRLGHVTDFLNFDVSSIIDIPFANWPVFNVADMAVVSGIFLLAFLMLKDPEITEIA